MIIRPRAMCGTLVLALLAPVAAAAQAPRNPFAELFGRTPERIGREYTAIQFRSTAGAQVGETIEQGLQAPDTVIPDGLSGGADASVEADYMRDRVQVAGRARYAYQEFRKAPSFGVPAIDAGIRTDVKVTTRLAARGGAQFARSPYFQLTWMTPAQAGSMAPIDRTAILLMRNDSVEGSAGFTSTYSKRSSIDVSAQVRRTDFELQPQHNFLSIGGRAQWRRQMTRDLAVRAGYGREQLRPSELAGDLLYTNELLDVGVDYAKSLSIARRTSLSFSTETSLLRNGEGGKHFRLNGHVQFQKGFQRTWVTLLSARRSTDFMPGFTAPVLSDYGNAALAGYVAKRLLLNVNAAGGRGEVGFNDSRKFISYSGDAKLTYAITRNLGVFSQYLYYHYQNPPDPQTLFLLPRVSRQAVSVGVQTWISLYEKDKVTRDPR